MLPIFATAVDTGKSAAVVEGGENRLGSLDRMALSGWWTGGGRMKR